MTSSKYNFILTITNAKGGLVYNDQLVDRVVVPFAFNLPRAEMRDRVGAVRRATEITDLDPAAVAEWDIFDRLMDQWADTVQYHRTWVPVSSVLRFGPYTMDFAETKPATAPAVGMYITQSIAVTAIQWDPEINHPCVAMSRDEALIKMPREDIHLGMSRELDGSCGLVRTKQGVEFIHTDHWLVWRDGPDNLPAVLTNEAFNRDYVV